MNPGAEPGCVYLVRSPPAVEVDETELVTFFVGTVEPDRGGIGFLAPFRTGVEL